VKVTVFSSFTFTYLNRARVLFATLREHHPDWELVALITDAPPPGFTFKPKAEPFDRVVWARDLGIPDFDSWIFKHDVVEACTAVKGPFMHQACQAGDADAVIYLDPDTALFGRLDPLMDLLADHDIVLTPHLIDPNDETLAILDNDLAASKTGIFNLGFCAIRTRGEGARFAKWWNDRLLAFCYDDIPAGLFVDQRWCDHVPALFDRVKVLRDPGYNVASWNLSRRKLKVEKDGRLTVNGAPLRFWHFTKLGPLGDAMTRRYALDNFPVYEIWRWYRDRVAAASDPRIPERWWAYEAYDDARPIEKPHRVLYRQRPDLQSSFPRPFAGDYQRWLEEEAR
jgi:hypothetical protein